ncbi:MAG TPA: ABC transporter substrate-binding protein [Firmicutes bacterium]|nr:ABC transporter substrate-binding protein [Bacillota bacterium]
MKKYSKAIKYIIIIIVLTMGIIIVNSLKNNDNRVVIYSAAEDEVNEAMIRELKNKFPKYDIVLEFMSSGNIATKLAAEKTNTSIDIVYDLEYGSIGLVSDYLENLEYDESKYNSEFITNNEKYVPVALSSNAIVINKKELEKKGLEIPKSYSDLLKPEYKNLIAMPNPTVSGTGYIFLKSLVNAMGEDEAYKYFDKLTNNVLEYTSSGLVPVSLLERGEIAIAMGPTSVAARSITNGYDFDITWYKEGAPYTYYVMSVVKDRLAKPPVKEVYEYIEKELNEKVNKECAIESVYKNSDYKIPNYPDNIQFSDMSNYTSSEKERLLNKWKY